MVISKITGNPQNVCWMEISFVNQKNEIKRLKHKKNISLLFVKCCGTLKISSYNKSNISGFNCNFSVLLNIAANSVNGGFLQKRTVQPKK